MPSGYILRGTRSTHSSRPIHFWTARIETLFVLSSQHFLPPFSLSKSGPFKHVMDGSDARARSALKFVRSLT